MTLRFEQPVNRWATWSVRLAAMALQLLVVGVLLHRFASLPTPVALNLLVCAYAGAGLAALLAVVAIVRIWREGATGAFSAAMALVLGGLMFAWPAYYVPAALLQPSLRDVTTDFERPPVFVALSPARRNAGLPDAYPGGKLITVQQQAFADIAPLLTTRSVSDTFDLVNDVLRKLDYTIVAAQAPGIAGLEGYVEATDYSLIMGLPDDISIRVRPVDALARIDVRSASRYGQVDFGKNVARVRQILAKLQASIDASVPAGPATGPEVASQEADQQATASLKKAKSGSLGGEVRRKKRVRARPGAQGGQGSTSAQR